MTRLRASIILVAFAFGILAGPLFASTGTCPMPCCKHAKQTSVRMPSCPLPQSCPSMNRDAESANGDNATPAPAQPVVHAAPALVAVTSAPAPRVNRESTIAPRPPDSAIYLFDSVFRI